MIVFVAAEAFGELLPIAVGPCLDQADDAPDKKPGNQGNERW
jgi:hypothetical protein